MTDRYIDEIERRNNVLTIAARALLERLDVIHADEAYRGVWETSQQHIGPYAGPKYDKELQALREALAELTH